EVDFLNGLTQPVRWEDDFSDANKRLTLDIRDKWKQLENFRFPDEVPLDRLYLDVAFTTILEIAGWDLDSEVDIPEIGFQIPFGGPCGGSGDDATRWTCKIEVGDSAAEWLERLHSSYCANFYMRIRPTATGVKFVLKRRRTGSRSATMTNGCPSRRRRKSSSRDSTGGSCGLCRR
ncbi:hypothetical protein KW797_04095, partial [Candidatus Parcubacteria bacterium]|nr:hypothetical protein [Candidatus Parcubacteria bacterium]